MLCVWRKVGCSPHCHALTNMWPLSVSEKGVHCLWHITYTQCNTVNGKNIKRVEGRDTDGERKGGIWFTSWWTSGIAIVPSRGFTEICTALYRAMDFYVRQINKYLKKWRAGLYSWWEAAAMLTAEFDRLGRRGCPQPFCLCHLHLMLLCVFERSGAVPPSHSFSFPLSLSLSLSFSLSTSPVTTDLHFWE